MLRYLFLLAMMACTGCSLLPEIAHQPTLHNPFPQLSKVAVAPFFNLSVEPTVSGKQFAQAYFNELQLVPGFEVIPVGVTERAMQEHKIALAGPADARKLAQILGVDAVVLGAVTDYSPYYPPRCAMQVEWYAANPGFHPIPAGYGLPWGTPEEKDIPAPLVYEAEFALAKAQLATQTPNCPNIWSQMAAPQGNGSPTAAAGGPGSNGIPPTAGAVPATAPTAASAAAAASLAAPAAATAAIAGTVPGSPPGMPANWPDPRGFIPPPPSPQPPACLPSDAPVLRHTQTFNGHDSEFTEGLSSYYFFRDDARFGGWQSYLQRSDDFIRFCCHEHIWAMLSARGGAGETRVVWRWPSIR